MSELTQHVPIPTESGPDREAALVINLQQESAMRTEERLQFAALLHRLGEAITDTCWKAAPYGETEDGDTYAYIVPKGTMHRLIGVAQGAGISAAFRASSKAEEDG